jgi:ABC-2 type transport system permease protein
MNKTNNRTLLLRTMLVSSSNFNILKYSDDKKKRGLAIGNIIGLSFLYLLVAVYAGAMSYGLAYFGMAEIIPTIPAVIIVALSLIMTFFKAHGMLFGYKEYDMLMSMPFAVKNVVADRFLYMYIKNLPLTCVISFAALIGMAIADFPGVWAVIWWVVLTLFLPVIPMLIAVSVSALIGGVGSGFKYKNIVLSILTFIIVMPLFFARFFIQDIVANDKIEEVVSKSGEIFDGAGTGIPMVKWFADAVNENSVSSALLLIGLSVICYEVVFIIISKFYKSINSRMSAHSSSHARVQDKDFKARTTVSSIAYKEFKRFTGSVAYSTNVGMGAVMAAVFGILVLFLDVNKLVSSMAGVDVDVTAASPALIVTVFLYFCTGMMPSTACSMSLEGKNYWVIKSLPFDMYSVFKGKMLFNILLFLPVSVFAVIMSCISMRAPLIEFLAGIVYIVSAVLFSTVYGMYCGAKRMNLEWENEIQVIKQGSAVTAYLLPNMFGTMILGGGLITLGVIFKMLPLIMFAMAAMYLLFTLLSYHGVKKLAKRM